MNKVREEIEEQMSDLMNEMSTREQTGEDYEKLSKRLVELGKVRNEALKIECDYERQAEASDVEAETKETQLKEEKRQFRTKTILDCVKIGASLLLFVGLAMAEGKGTFVNMSTKDLFRSMKFGIKS